MKPQFSVVLLFLASSLHGQAAPPVQPLVSVDRSGSPLSSNTISKDELLVPPKAIKELRRSQKDYASGNVRSSARHLENALRLYPNNLEAHNNLGAQYIELREYEKAITELRRAIQIDKNIVQPFNNLSVALFQLRRYPDAETAARDALAIDPNNTISRYVLGCSLTMEYRSPAEALEMLRATKKAFPDSRLLIAKILLRQGAVEPAKQELQDYLTVPGIEKRAIVERWLAQLTQPPDAAKSAERPNRP